MTLIEGLPKNGYTRLVQFCKLHYREPNKT